MLRDKCWFRPEPLEILSSCVPVLYDVNEFRGIEFLLRGNNDSDDSAQVFVIDGRPAHAVRGVHVVWITGEMQRCRNRAYGLPAGRSGGIRQRAGGGRDSRDRRKLLRISGDADGDHVPSGPGKIAIAILPCGVEIQELRLGQPVKRRDRSQNGYVVLLLSFPLLLAAKRLKELNRLSSKCGTQLRFRVFKRRVIQVVERRQCKFFRNEEPGPIATFSVGNVEPKDQRLEPDQDVVEVQNVH